MEREVGSSQRLLADRYGSMFSFVRDIMKSLVSLLSGFRSLVSVGPHIGYPRLQLEVKCFLRCFHCFCVNKSQWCRCCNECSWSWALVWEHLAARRISIVWCTSVLSAYVTVCTYKARFVRVRQHYDANVRWWFCYSVCSQVGCSGREMIHRKEFTQQFEKLAHKLQTIIHAEKGGDPIWYHPLHREDRCNMQHSCFRR